MLGAARGLAWSRWRRATRSAAARPRLRCCTRRPASATPSPRSPPRALTARRWWSSSASRTAATSRSTRSWPAACTAWRASTRCGSTSPRARRTSRARSSAPTTRRRPARGPAIVIVPMDDWLAPAPEPHETLGPAAPAALGRPPTPPRSRRSPRCSTARRRARRSSPARAPTAPTAGPRSSRSPSASRCPVFQEPFGGQAGFPQDHPLFAGHLPAAPRAAARDARAARRRARRRHGRVPPVPVRRRARWSSRARGSRVVTQDPEEAHRSPVELAVLGDPAAVCAALARPVDARPAPVAPALSARPPAAAGAAASRCAPATCSPRSPSGCRATRSCVEETPVEPPRAARAHPRHRAARASSARWGCSASRCRPRSACGMARPDRPVLAVVGDGSSLYQIQALWSAAAYRVGVLFVVLRQRRLRDHGPARRAHRRRRAVAGARHDRHRRDGPRSGAARRAAIESHADLLERARRRAADARRPRRRRCCSRSSSRRTTTFDP